MEFWITRTEILLSSIFESRVLHVALAFVLSVLAALYVYYSIYVRDEKKRKTLIIIAAATPLVVIGAVAAGVLTAPPVIGFKINKTHIVVDVGWWGVPRGAVYEVDKCQVDWLRTSEVKIYRAMGFGAGRITVGRLTIRDGASLTGYGLVVEPSEWIAVARCPDAILILSAPGLSPDAAR